MDVPRSLDQFQTIFENFIAETYPIILAVIAIALYSGFVFLFYRFLARKDILTLDLSKFEKNYSGKFRLYFRIVFHIGLYIVLIPILIAFWTLILAMILTLFASDPDHARNALIATAVVGAIRILSYWTEELSRDVAKMLPFAVLGVFLVDSTAVHIDSIISLIESWPELANSWWNSLILLSILEVILRAINGLYNFFWGKRQLKKKLKGVAIKTGRSEEDILNDIQDDGKLNQSNTLNES
jgi:hypothetical protein|tara:strand:+ start:617 stop:1339 length:723 start_codon:yes stop_codon:yes gene_type:complete